MDAQGIDLLKLTCDDTEKLYEKYRDNVAQVEENRKAVAFLNEYKNEGLVSFVSECFHKGDNLLLASNVPTRIGKFLANNRRNQTSFARAIIEDERNRQT